MLSSLPPISRIGLACSSVDVADLKSEKDGERGKSGKTVTNGKARKLGNWGTGDNGKAGKGAKTGCFDVHGLICCRHQHLSNLTRVCMASTKKVTKKVTKNSLNCFPFRKYKGGRLAL